MELPDERFRNWDILGDYYSSIGEHYHFNERISGGSALARVLKECEASVLFAKPNLPTKYNELENYLRYRSTTLN